MSRDAGSPAALIAAAGRALAAHPGLNGAYRDGAIETHSRRNVGLIVETDDGALVPTVFDADTKTVADIDAEIDELSAAVRAGTLASPAFAGATFTITVLAAGADAIAAPVTPGQAAHLGAGRVRSAIVPGAGGDPVAAEVIDLDLSCDARAVRPPAAAAFLEALADLLAAPAAEI